MAYTVKKGDTLSAIAKANNTTVKAIQAANPQITNVNLIRPGQVFQIPKSSSASSTPATGTPFGQATGAFSELPKVTPVTEPKQPLDAGVVTPKAPTVPTGEVKIEQPVIPQTVSPTQNISTSTSAPTYTAPVLTPVEIVATQEAKTAELNRVNALDVLKQRFSQFGLESLAPVIQNLAAEGASEATVTFALQNTPEYKERFKANEVRLKKGLAVMTPAEYISLEDTYRQVLRSYGLKQFDNDAYVSQFIANDVSPTELTGRVQAATSRVLNASPEVATTLKKYYNLGAQDLVAYALDPESQLSEIQKKITAAEIGTAAFTQGLQSNVATSEQLAMQGVTQEQARQGYSTIADILPASKKLSEIYGGLDAYGQTQAEQEVFGGMASEKRKREKLAQTEAGTFSGKSGISSGALGSQGKGTF